jgi:hypothetical protein
VIADARALLGLVAAEAPSEEPGGVPPRRSSNANSTSFDMVKLSRTGIMSDVLTSRERGTSDQTLARSLDRRRRESDRATRSVAPARIVMVTRGDERRAWRIIDAFVERTGLEARRSERVAEFWLRLGERNVQVVATLTDIDRDWRDHVDLGPLS